MYLLVQKKHFHFAMLNVLKGAKTNQHRPRFKMPHPHSPCIFLRYGLIFIHTKKWDAPQSNSEKVVKLPDFLEFPYQTKIHAIIIVGATFEGKSWCLTRTLSCNLLFLDNCKSLDHLAIYSKSTGCNREILFSSVIFEAQNWVQDLIHSPRKLTNLRHSF